MYCFASLFLFLFLHLYFYYSFFKSQKGDACIKAYSITNIFVGIDILVGYAAARQQVCYYYITQDRH